MIINKHIKTELIDKTLPNYNTKLKIIEETQEIIDSFLLDSTKSADIDNKVALLHSADNNEIPSIITNFKENLEESEHKFNVSLLDINNITLFSGSFGNFTATFSDDSSATFSQAVLFVHDDNLIRFNGVYSVADFESPPALIECLGKNIGTCTYKEVISYKDDYCQYNERREKHCAKCVDICPTFGVGGDDSIMKLVFSHIDCISCGACIGVCPTNCLEYEELPKEGLEEIIDLYKDTKVFLCDYSGYEELINNNIILDESLTPMVLPNIKMLNENDYLTILQTSGYDVVIYNKNSILESVVSFINNITNQIYNRDSLLIADIHNINELSDKAQKFPEYLYKNRYSKPYRESFSQRIQYMIKDKDYGMAQSIAPTYYGNVSINKEKCTLCLSCVGACNVNAIFARSDDFSLRFNPSICTTCGYCVDSCPEKVIELHRNGMELNSNYFKSKELAKDEPFKCVECGKVFSTKKSIDKIATMMSVAFANDPKRLKTLQCCSDCKVKVMFATN